MTTKKEIPWVNTLKGGCILLVVLYHVMLPGYADTASLLTAGQLPAKLWLAFNQHLSPLRMPAFFFVSGMLAANAILNRPWKQVFTSRVTNLFYLYFLWGAIQWLMINGVSQGIMGEHLSDNINAAWADSPWQFLKLMLLAMSSSWYLYALALFFLFARLFRQQKPLILLVAVVLNYAAVSNIIPGWGPESLSQYFIFFLFGAFYSELLIRWSEWRRDNLLPWALLTVLAAGHSLLGLQQSLFLCVLAILFCIAFCRWLNQTFSMRWLNWVGKNTLQIYVLHRIFIEFFGLSAILFAVSHQLFASPSFSLLWAVGFPLLMVLLCVGCSVAVWTLLNRGWGQSLFIYPKLLRMKFDAR
ncbi:acyltransferase family protein [Erwinia sp. J316]|uniref:Acyltransferase family protein n=2 Tax=Erwinia sorbitola TaxID=2681984 RepID=A0A6I6EDI1_9GAMM|nr:acyltransferase family protein [Erwinia sorbitola]MTD25577.1 acyltransferase family protein [Erwinia sorbitola]QGU87864.1 acyltransferase family protein [Erwinia sorbitola]